MSRQLYCINNTLVVGEGRGGESTSPVFECVGNLCCKHRMRRLYGLFFQESDPERKLIGRSGMLQMRDREFCRMD